MKLLKELFSPFTLLLTFILILATLFPAQNQWAIYLNELTFYLIVLLFLKVLIPIATIFFPLKVAGMLTIASEPL